MNAQPMPSARPEPAGTGINAATLLRALRKHWWLTLVVLVACVAGSAAYTSQQPRIYEAAATLQLDPQALRPLGRKTADSPESGPDTYWSNLEYFQTQHQIITSRKIASLVVRKLGLDRDGGFLTGTPGKAPPGFTVESAAEMLRARVSVRAIQESRLVQVSVRDADPQRAQRVLNALLDVYVEQNLDATLDSAGKTAEWLDTQLGKLKTELEAQEMDLHDFKKTNNLLSVSFDDQSNMLRAQIQQLNATLTELKARREHVAARLSVIQQVDPVDPSVIPQSELLGNGALAPLRDRYLLAKRDLQRLLTLGKGENHPEVQTAKVEQEAARAAVIGELKNIQDGVASDLATVQRELAGVSGLYETAKQQALGLNLNELRYSRLRRSKDNTERVFGLVLERSTQSDMSKLMPFNNVRVLDRPLLPRTPVLPRPLTNLTFGAVAGLLLGLLGALGRELLDRTVRNAEELEHELGVPTLGSLPNANAKHGNSGLYGAYYGTPGKKRPKASNPPGPEEPAELLVHTHSKSVAAEAARSICTNLLFTSPDKPFRSLLVTSAGPAEGKTTVAASIAIGLAQTGRRVCLVDIDLRRPRVHSLFGLKPERGVTTAMLDLGKLDELITETVVPNLSALPAGPTPPNPADLMHSEAFARLLEALKARFDVVVFDSPPACIVTDAVVAATRVDACLLVVRWHRTRREAPRRALRALRDVGANCVGFVMNAVQATGDSYQYSYYRYEEAPQPKS